MMTARVKQARSFVQETIEENTDFLLEGNDAVFDLLDGVYERQGERVSNTVKLLAGLTQVNLELASKTYDILIAPYRNAK